LMILKLVAIAALIGFGFAVTVEPRPVAAAESNTLFPFAAAMTPVMFAYGGWQTASFMSAELKRPRRDLAIGLLAGVAGVITVYVLVNAVMLHVLGAAGLAQTATPASAVMRIALGERGAKLIAVGIAISTLGFLSQSMLTAPRVYYAMATDRVFFRAVARVHPVTKVPYIAIVLQGLAAIAIALSGKYDQILSYVVAVDFIFFGLTGLALFVFRARGERTSEFRTPGHPITTGLFTLACWMVVIATVVRSPVQSAIGFAILATGAGAYAVWRKGGERMKDEG
jgi:APA family basic amino acid/polyamine antiporter